MLKLNTKKPLEMIKNYILILLIYILKIFKYISIWIYNAFSKISPIIFWPIKKILKPIIIKLYHLRFKIKTQKNKIPEAELFDKTDKNNIILFPYIILIIFGIFVITNNLFGKIPEIDELSKKSLISKIIPSENDSYAISKEIITDEDIIYDSNFHIDSESGSLESPLPQLITEVSQTKLNSIQLTDFDSSMVGIQLSEEAIKSLPRDKIIDYTVEAGDTLSAIAQNFNISITTILWSNNLTYYSVMRPGMVLKILPTTGLIHTVQRGDNLSSIAKKYQADAEKILQYNKLTSSEEIKIGQNLIIPDGIKPASATSYVPRQTSGSANYGTAPTTKAPIINTGTKLLWPTAAKRITQYFSWRHSGLDIAGPVGTAIYAADDGVVETAGWNKGGYGNYIIINHGNSIKTLYGHASKLYVVAGQHVSKGQVIMAMGSTGRSTGPHLHFEVRISGGFRNPLSYIR